MIIHDKRLLECPFCGHKTPQSPFVVREKYYDDNIFDNGEKARKASVWHHVVCLKCKCQSGDYSSVDEAVKNWNVRATQSVNMSFKKFAELKRRSEVCEAFELAELCGYRFSRGRDEIQGVDEFLEWYREQTGQAQ